jgi:hypothetical protein
MSRDEMRMRVAISRLAAYNLGTLGGYAVAYRDCPCCSGPMVQVRLDGNRGLHWFGLADVTPTALNLFAAIEESSHDA